MICIGESLPDGGTTYAEVAIVGAGAVGVALAVRLCWPRRPYRLDRSRRHAIQTGP